MSSIFFLPYEVISYMLWHADYLGIVRFAQTCREAYHVVFHCAKVMITTKTLDRLGMRLVPTISSHTADFSKLFLDHAQYLDLTANAFNLSNMNGLRTALWNVENTTSIVAIDSGIMAQVRSSPARGRPRSCYVTVCYLPDAPSDVALVPTTWDVPISTCRPIQIAICVELDLLVVLCHRRLDRPAVNASDPLELQFYSLSKGGQHPVAVMSMPLGDLNGLDLEGLRGRLRVRLEINGRLLLVVIIDTDNPRTAFIAVANWTLFFFGVVRLRWLLGGHDASWMGVSTLGVTLTCGALELYEMDSDHPLLMHILCRFLLPTAQAYSKLEMFTISTPPSACGRVGGCPGIPSFYDSKRAQILKIQRPVAALQEREGVVVLVIRSSDYAGLLSHAYTLVVELAYLMRCARTDRYMRVVAPLSSATRNAYCSRVRCIEWDDWNECVRVQRNLDGHDFRKGIIGNNTLEWRSRFDPRLHGVVIEDGVFESASAMDCLILTRYRLPAHEVVVVKRSDHELALRNLGTEHSWTQSSSGEGQLRRVAKRTVLFALQTHQNIFSEDIASTLEYTEVVSAPQKGFSYVYLDERCMWAVRRDTDTETSQWEVYVVSRAV